MSHLGMEQERDQMRIQMKIMESREEDLRKRKYTQHKCTYIYM